MSGIDLERALNDPADLFESPDAVVHHPTLTREQKVHVWMAPGPQGEN
jgi:hypothetical protein